MAELYTLPPIQEAIVEFSFEEEGWTVTTVGELYQEFKPEYPAPPVSQQQIVGTPVPQDTSVQFISASRIAFGNTAGDRVVTVSQSTLSVHAVRTYPGWQSFLQQAEDALARYRKIRAPTALRRLAVRAVNRIALTDDLTDLSSWFARAPRPLSPQMDRPSLFAHRETFACPNGAWLLVNFATPQPTDRPSAIILDLNAILSASPPESLGWSDAARHLEELHTYVKEAFEASILPPLRERFRAASP